MHDGPSPPLLDLLQRLQLGVPKQMRAVRRRAMRLARGAPLVDVVWVDAWVQARLLTPYQGAEINAGRGERLVVGPYLLRRLTAQLGYANSFFAIERESKTTVQLVVARRETVRGESDNNVVASALAGLLAKFASVESSGVAKLLAAGCDGEMLWAAYAQFGGVCVAQWLACQGRFPPGAALEIARQTATALAALESAGIVHGDISASALRIASGGGVQLTRAGIRGIVRPDETADTELLPIEAFDYLAPRRIAERTGPSIAADVFAFGCLCCHLLTGRTPLAGGNLSAKLAAVVAAKIPDIRRFAPETPTVLLAVLERSIRVDETERPQSFAEIAQALGPPTTAGRRLLIDVIARSRCSTIRPDWKWRLRTGMRRAGTQLAAAAACAVLLAAATWPLWRSHPGQGERVLAVQQGTNGLTTHRAALSVSEPRPLGSGGDRPLPDGRGSEIPVTLRRAEYSKADSDSVALDAKIQLANYQAAEPTRPIVELPSGVEIPGASLRLEPGATVRGRNSQRVRILAPPNGLVVAADDVRFENVDFIWRHRPERITSPDRIAIVDQRGRNAEFVGCTFQAAEAAPFGLPPAIRLRGGAARSATLAPSCRVRLERCMVSDVAAAVEGTSAGPMAVEIHDTLHIARGPLIRLADSPAIDAPVAIELKHLTVRGASSVIELAGGGANVVAGSISIESVGCAFALESTGALLAFTGPTPPKTAANGRASIEWTGQGSVSMADTVVAIWQHDGAIETLPDDLLAVEGLVSGKLEFAGLAENDPAKSRLTNWLAPLLDDQPPGIGDLLPKLPPLTMSAIVH